MSDKVLSDTERGQGVLLRAEENSQYDFPRPFLKRGWIVRGRRKKEREKGRERDEGKKGGREKET